LHWRPPGARLSGRLNLAAFDFLNGSLLLTEAGTKRGASLHVLTGEEGVSLSRVASHVLDFEEWCASRQLGERLRRTMNVEKLVREFNYNGIRLPDPNVEISIEEVRNLYATAYPDITTAAIEGPEAVGNKLIYRFSRSIGTKG